MKTVRCLILFLCFGFFVGCSDDDNENTIPEVTPELSASPLDLAFSSEGGTQEINIISNTVWRIEFDTESWCRPTIQTAKGNAKVNIVVDANGLNVDRRASFTLRAVGVEDITINITQEKNEGGEDPSEEDYIEPDKTGMRELTALEFSKNMTVGWNLGNSLESIAVSNGEFTGNETSWGNPRVTQLLIDKVKAAGFNTIRIPVSWSHNIENASTFKIKKEWMQRVTEVVNYAISNDMFVMINVHWDGGWMDHPDNAHKDEINIKLAALWKQIAISFRDYDDRLLFAGTNEVHVENSWADPSTENVDAQNSFNQKFVDVVRATGGRNTYRHLIVQAYNTNIAHAVKYLKIPTDQTLNKLMSEVHFYDPYDFALQEDAGYKTLWGKDFSGANVSTWGQEDWVDETFKQMKTNFVDKGIPVIVGEYGALLRSSLSSGLEDHIKARNYYLKYVTQSAKSNGLVPVYWDNGNTGNNGFGLFNRNTGETVHPEAVKSIMDGLNQ